MADASYVGNITRRLPVSLNQNFIPPEVLNSIPVDQRQAYFTAQVPNPMAGLLPGTGINGATTTRAQLLYAYPQYSQVTHHRCSSRKSAVRFRAVQARAAHVFGLDVDGSVHDRKDAGASGGAERAGRAVERPHLDTAREAIDSVRCAATVLGHRVLRPALRQGPALLLRDEPMGERRVRRMDGQRRLDVTLGLPAPVPERGAARWESANFSDAQRDALAQQKGRPQYDISEDVWFDTSLFPRTARNPYVLQTFPTRFPDVRTKPLNVADVSIYKEFRMNERVRLQVRADAHNVGNFPWFGNLDSNGANVTSSKFGFLRADMGNEVRVIVGVMKLVF